MLGAAPREKPRRPAGVAVTRSVMLRASVGLREWAGVKSPSRAAVYRIVEKKGDCTMKASMPSCVLLLALLYVSAVAAQTTAPQPKRFDLDYAAKIVRLSDPQISPDGK